MFRRISLALALLTGCGGSKLSAPSAPGTSVKLTYPVVLIGQGDLGVRDDELALTTAAMASGLNFPERRIVDSTGIIYEVKGAAKVDPSSAWWRDMGTSQEAYFLELEPRRSASLEEIRQLVLEQLASAQGIWQNNANAVARVKGFGSVTDLIAGCRTSWDWNH